MAEEDRINSLPDHLLLEIISRIKIMDKRKQEERLMSTKEVIRRTCTISKRWRHLWTRLPTLVFIDNDFKIRTFRKKKKKKDFMIRDITKHILYIDKILAQLPIDVNLKKFQYEIEYTDLPTLQVNSWIHYAITRNVQELRIKDGSGNQSCHDELFFSNSCLISMEVSGFKFNPPNGAIRWDKLKFLHIDKRKLDEDLIGKILTGSPCLETLELNDCDLVGRIPKSLFGNFGVLERLSCYLETYKKISYDDELFLDDSCHTMSMKFSRRVFNPPTGGIGCDKLKFLCIHRGDLNEDLIGYILSASPFLETLQLNDCYGVCRIDVASKSVKNLVLTCYSQSAGYFRDTLEISAPYISSLTIEGVIDLEEILLQNVSSLVKADLNYWVHERYAEERLGRDGDVVEEELLQGLLSSLGHVNKIALQTYTSCPWARTYLEATGFQFHKGSYLRGICPTANEFSH